MLQSTCSKLVYNTLNWNFYRTTDKVLVNAEYAWPPQWVWQHLTRFAKNIQKILSYMRSLLCVSQYLVSKMSSGSSNPGVIRPRLITEVPCHCQKTYHDAPKTCQPFFGVITKFQSRRSHANQHVIVLIL